jgi:hypothetical protein
MAKINPIDGIIGKDAPVQFYSLAELKKQEFEETRI